MNNHHLNSKFKFFIPYACIFLIPFICLSLFLHYYFIVKSKNQLESVVESAALEFEDNLLNSITRLNRMTTTIKNNSKLTKYYINHRAILNETSETLKQFTNIDTILDEIILYYPNNQNKYYSSQGYYSETSLLKQKFNLSDNAASQVAQLFNSEDSGLFTIDKARMPQLLLISKIDNTNHNSGKFIFLLNTPSFITSIRQRNNYEFVILNHKDEFIYSSKIITEDTLYSVINHDYNSNFNFISSDGDILVTTNTLGLPFKIVLLVQENTFLIPLHRLKLLFYFGLFSLFLMGLSVSWHFANKHYRPVKNIADNLNSLLPLEYGNKIDHLTSNNIYHYLQQNINYIIENQYELSHQIKVHKQQYINTLYKYILEGNSLDPIDLQMIKSEMKIFNESIFFTVLIHSSLLQDNLEEFMHISTNCFEFFSITSQYSQDYTPIFCHYDQEKISINTVCQQIIYYVQKNNHHIVPLFIGRTGNHVMSFYDSYLDTLYLLEQYSEKLHNSTSPFIFFEENGPVNKTDINYIFSTNFIKLRNALSNANLDICHTTINEIIGIAKNPSTNPIMAKSLLYEIVNCLMKYASEYNISIPQSLYEQLSVNFNPYHSQDVLLNFSKYICLEIDAILKNKKYNINNDIINYVTSNYRRPDFNIELVSEKLNVSISLINQTLKEYTGITFSKYVQQLRFNYVKEQLTSTDETIKNIINNSGYIDASNFTRQFKSIYGCTPGQYRKNYRSRY